MKRIWSLIFALLESTLVKGWLKIRVFAGPNIFLLAKSKYENKMFLKYQNDISMKWKIEFNWLFIVIPGTVMKLLKIDVGCI